MPWDPVDPAWQYELLDRVAPGVDTAQLEEALRLSPTERLERLQHLVDFVEEVSRARGNRFPQVD